MQSLDAFASEKLRALEAADLRRSLAASARGEGLWVERGGRRLLSFSCNDYLNLTRHPLLRRAATAAIEAWGTGAGASRLVTGNHPLYAELETRLARLKGSEAACVFGSGYLANTGVIPALVGAGDLVLLDALAHACIWTGARLSGAAIRSFRHNDAADAAALLTASRKDYRRALIVTEGVFSMDGDIAPLAALAELARQCDAWLMSDDAHGVGVLGQGRGSAAALGIGAGDIPLQMGTLSKALGSYGGYLCASREVIDLMHNRARTLVYSTGLPPASVAAAIAALDIIASDPGLTERPLAKARRFTALAGLSEAQSPIVPIIVGPADAALAASRRLEEEDFLVTAIRPPTVPEGTARLRLAFCAAHPDEAIERLAGLVGSFIRR
ncbi:MAG TPA: 8-amino-7-oxononanoate synthase [Stellaceae bacterium]|jgi:8-amino-7-oxononanoate synthase|nr:8-amino-7-oxononanoate synthase [Stellaceae bacterium]